MSVGLVSSDGELDGSSVIRDACGWAGREDGGCSGSFGFWAVRGKWKAFEWWEGSEWESWGEGCEGREESEDDKVEKEGGGGKGEGVKEAVTEEEEEEEDGEADEGVDGGADGGADEVSRALVFNKAKFSQSNESMLRISKMISLRWNSIILRVWNVKHSVNIIKL